MHRLARLFVVLAAGAGLRAQTPVGPGPATASVANASLHGVVRDGLTHKPVAGAEVELVWIVPHAKEPRSTFTTSRANGSYGFSHLAQHPYFIVVKQAHYVSETFFANEQSEGGLELVAGMDREVELALTPEAEIDGTVVDAAGKPVAGVSVAAVRERAVGGVMTYDYIDDDREFPGVEFVTDKAGHYRVAGLPAGTYAVLARLDRLRANPAPEAVAAVENGSLPVYLGGVFSLRHASRLSLVAGVTAHANFTLTPHERHMIRGTLHFTSAPDGRFEQPLVSMEEPFNGPRNFQPWEIQYDRKMATFALGPVVPGDYDLTMATGLYFDKDLFGRRSVTVGEQDAEDVDLTLSPRFSLKVKIVTSRILPRGEKAALLHLQREVDPLLEAGYPVDRSGALEFINLEPGHYTLHLFSQEPFVLESARYGKEDVLAHGLTLQGAPGALLVVTLGYTASREP